MRRGEELPALMQIDDGQEMTVEDFLSEYHAGRSYGMGGTESQMPGDLVDDVYAVTGDEDAYTWGRAAAALLPYVQKASGNAG